MLWVGIAQMPKTLRLIHRSQQEMLSYWVRCLQWSAQYRIMLLPVVDGAWLILESKIRDWKYIFEVFRLSRHHTFILVFSVLLF